MLGTSATCTRSFVSQTEPVPCPFQPATNKSLQTHVAFWGKKDFSKHCVFWSVRCFKVLHPNAWIQHPWSWSGSVWIWRYDAKETSLATRHGQRACEGISVRCVQSINEVFLVVSIEVVPQRVGKFVIQQAGLIYLYQLRKTMNLSLFVSFLLRVRLTCSCWNPAARFSSFCFIGWPSCHLIALQD